MSTKNFAAGATIMANATRVWELITNPEQLTAWDSGISRIDGAIRANSKFKLHAAVAGRPFSLTVTEFEPPRRMVWQGGMPLGLFKGVRTFTLTEENGVTDFHVEEVFSGLMLPLIWKSMPDLQPSFDQFAAGLKVAAEGPPH